MYKTIVAAVFLIVFFISCGSPAKKNKNIIGAPIEKVLEEPPATPIIPESAVAGNYYGDSILFYAYIKELDTLHFKTTIAFEGDKYPEFIIPETRSAKLAPLHFSAENKDILLVTTTLKDTSFTKYFLYILKDSVWKPMVNGFAIHNSNRPDTLTPIRINPLNDGEVIRYYSVFDLDTSGKEKYSWRLLKENIPISKEKE